MESRPIVASGSFGELLFSMYESQLDLNVQYPSTAMEKYRIDGMKKLQNMVVANRGKLASFNSVCVKGWPRTQEL
jgi:hypothetical protein